MNDTRYRFSIIIPLEFHRGQLEACLRGWVHHQTYPRASFEIVAAGCRHTLDSEAISAISAELGPHDRLLLFDEHHDMALVAQAAAEAKGDNLLFTESHCLPEPGLLARAEAALAAHPEWAGFSGKSLPITHNRLSVVEAEMYQADIDHGMFEHAWRKILDQIFIVRRSAYRESGGFQPRLGHFAEWHLAARMHWQGQVLGYAPDVQVRHFYVGDAAELAEFSADFTHGEMTNLIENSAEPFFHYFPEPDEWLARHTWSPTLASAAARLAGRVLAYPLPLTRQILTLAAKRTVLWIGFCLRRLFGVGLAVAAASLRSRAAYWGLRLSQNLPLPGAVHKKSLVKLIDRVVRHVRLQRIQRWIQSTAGSSVPSATPGKWPGWNPVESPEAFRSVGLQAIEAWQGARFRWTAPVTILELPFQPGEYSFTINWLPIRRLENLTFHVNERPLQIRRMENEAHGVFVVPPGEPRVRFSWTCDPWAQARDPRQLGLPLVSITWDRVNP